MSRADFPASAANDRESLDRDTSHDLDGRPPRPALRWLPAVELPGHLHELSISKSRPWFQLASVGARRIERRETIIIPHSDLMRVSYYDENRFASATAKFLPEALACQD